MHLSGCPYFEISAEPIDQDIRAGFLEGEILNAHTWLTLMCGTVIDLTILPSIHHKQNRRPLKFIQALYQSDKPGSYGITHEPLFLGPMFQIRCSGSRDETGLGSSFEWVKSIDELLSP